MGNDRSSQGREAAIWRLKKAVHSLPACIILTALDTGGFAALVELLTVYHLDVEGGYWRLEDEVTDDAG